MITGILRQPVALLLAGLLLALPFIQPWHFRPLTHFYSEWSSAALGLMICLLLLVQHTPIVSRPIPWLLGLAAFILLQSTWLTPVYWASVLGPVVYILGFGLLLMAGSRLREIHGFEMTVHVLVFFALAGGFLQALSGLIQLYGGPEWLSFWAEKQSFHHGIMGNAMQQNHFADHVMLGLVAGIYLHATTKLRTSIFAILSVIMLSALALSASRSVIAYFLVLIVTSLIWWQLCQRNQHEDTALLRKLLTTSGLLFIGFCLMQWLLPILNDMLSLHSVTTIDRIEDIIEGEVSGIGVRLDLWYKAWLIFLQHPWAGNGPDSYAWQVWLLDRSGAMGYTMHSHNLIAETAVSLGLSGLLLMGGLIFSCTRSVFAGGLKGHQWPVVAMCLILCVHAMLELPLWNLHFLLPFGLLIGICAGRDDGRELPGLRPVVLTLLVLMGVLVWHTAKSYRDLASLWLENQSYAQVMQRYMQAARNPLLAPIAESSIADMQLLSQDKIKAKIALYQKVIRYRPYPRAVFRQAILLGLAGRQEEGLVMMQQLLRLYPESEKYFKRNFCNYPLMTDDARRILKDWTASGAVLATVPTCHT